MLPDERDTGEFDRAQDLLYLLVDGILCLHFLTSVETASTTLIRRATLLEPGQSIVDAFPGQSVLQPNMACGRELVRTIQACGSHVDGVWFLVVPIGERRAATLAERPAHLIGRTVVGRLTVDEEEPFEGEGKPCDRLCARRPAARDAVADRRPQRLPGYPVSHPPAETPTLAEIITHPFSLPFAVPATILAAHRGAGSVRVAILRVGSSHKVERS